MLIEENASTVTRSLIPWHTERNADMSERDSI